MYQLTVSTTVVRIADGASFEPVASNSDGAAYLAWVGAGNTPTPYTPPPTPVPTDITMRQARLVLLGAGLLASVDTAIAAMPEPQKSAAHIEWEYSNAVQRHNGFVSALGTAIGLTEAQIDALFIAGAKL